MVELAYQVMRGRRSPMRLVKPKRGKPALLVLQIAGGRRTEPPPGWRMFLLEEIRGLTDQTFAKPGPNYKKADRGLKTVEIEVTR